VGAMSAVFGYKGMGAMRGCCSIHGALLSTPYRAALIHGQSQRGRSSDTEARETAVPDAQAGLSTPIIKSSINRE
jgi:hypothetical protein